MKRKFLRIVSAVLVLCMVSVPAFMALAAEEKTSFEFSFDSEYTAAKVTFADFRSLVNEQKTNIPIPGVKKTVFPGGEISEDMVPQGICVARKYVLVTAYDHEGVHNSVLYIISIENRNSPELVSTMVLPDKNHVGGVTFDGEYVWLAKSTSKKLSAIKFDTIENAANSKNGSYVLNEYYKNVSCDTTASFVTYYNGVIWVGLFDEANDGTLYGYNLVKNGEDFSLSQKYILPVPRQTQGAAFTERDGKLYLMTSSSYGVFIPSKLCLFEVALGSDVTKVTQVKQFEFPPMAEEIEFYNGSLFVMFESAAKEYSTGSGKALMPIDRICVLDEVRILSMESTGIVSFFDQLLEKIYNAIMMFFNNIAKIFK